MRMGHSLENFLDVKERSTAGPSLCYRQTSMITDDSLPDSSGQYHWAPNDSKMFPVPSLHLLFFSFFLLLVSACASSSFDPSTAQSTDEPSDLEVHGPPQWKPSLTWPVVNGRLTDRFETVRASHRIHKGIDIAKFPGAPVYAAAAGKVIYRGYESGYGNYVILKHKGGWTTRYAHLQRYNVNWSQKVTKGQQIGSMGNSGRSTGTHLHFEVRHFKKPKDPLAYLEREGLHVTEDFFGVPEPLQSRQAPRARLRSAYINGARVYLYY